MELEVVSTKPRAFLIDRFLSDFEADEIVKLASPDMAESRVGKYDFFFKLFSLFVSSNLLFLYPFWNWELAHLYRNRSA